MAAAKWKLAAAVKQSYSEMKYSHQRSIRRKWSCQSILSYLATKATYKWHVHMSAYWLLISAWLLSNAITSAKLTAMAISSLGCVWYWLRRSVSYREAAWSCGCHLTRSYHTEKTLIPEEEATKKRNKRTFYFEAVEALISEADYSVKQAA